MPETDKTGIIMIDTGVDDKEVIANTAFQGIDDRMHGARTVLTSNADVTLTTAQQKDRRFLEFTGGMTANRDVIFLAGSTQRVAVYNNTTGGFSLNFRYPSGGTQVTIGDGLTVDLQLDGTDVTQIGSISGSDTAQGTAFTPAGTLASNNIQDAITEENQSTTTKKSLAITGNTVVGLSDFTNSVLLELTGTPSADFTLETPELQPLSFDSGLINGGFDTGDTTGWSKNALTGGTANAAITAVTTSTYNSPQSGTYLLNVTHTGGQAVAEQIVDLTLRADFNGTNVDAGLVNIDLLIYRGRANKFQDNRIRIKALTSGGADIGVPLEDDTWTDVDGWVSFVSTKTLPATCRKIKIELITLSSSDVSAGFDSISLGLNDFGGAGLSNKGFKFIKNSTGRMATVSVDNSGGTAVKIPNNETRILHIDGVNVEDLSSDRLHEELTTTDATTTSVFTIGIPSGEAITIDVTGSMVEAATGDDYHFSIFAGAKNIGGTTTLTGRIVEGAKSAGANTWSIDVDVDDTGDTIRVRATGQAAHTILTKTDTLAWTRV